MNNKLHLGIKSIYYAVGKLDLILTPHAVCFSANPPLCSVETVNGQCCHFPFTYKGNKYTSCTTVNHNKPWCSLTANYQGKWGDCKGNR